MDLCSAYFKSNMDAKTGQILDALDGNPALKENTIVVFTSNHGDMQGGHRSMAKSFLFEECQRIPLIFAGPGIPVGKRIPSLVSLVDILPTLCDLVDI